MKTIGLLLLVVLSTMLGQEAARPPEQSAVPVPVEASAKVRESLGAGAKMKIYECLHDPATYPKLFERELETLRNIGLEQNKVAGQEVFLLDGADGIDPEMFALLRKTLMDSASIRPISGVVPAGKFSPEWAIAWTADGKNCHALVSLNFKRLIFVQDDTRLRYELTGDARSKLLESLSWRRCYRPDAIEELKPFLDALNGGAAIVIHEGTPRENLVSAEELKAESDRRGLLKIARYEFFKKGVTKRDTSTLRTLLAKEGTLTEWGGRSACGGFHPDFCISWGPEQSPSRILICFGCREAKVQSVDQSFLYKLSKEDYDELKEELEKYRPAKKNSAFGK